MSAHKVPGLLSSSASATTEPRKMFRDDGKRVLDYIASGGVHGRIFVNGRNENRPYVFLTLFSEGRATIKHVCEGGEGDTVDITKLLADYEYDPSLLRDEDVRSNSPLFVDMETLDAALRYMTMARRDMVRYSD